MLKGPEHQDFQGETDSFSAFKFQKAHKIIYFYCFT